MKFLLDQDVYASTGRLLSDLDHEVTTAARIGLATISDEELLQSAQERACILITRDRDFGALVFVRKLGSGVIYLRMLPSNQAAVHTELGELLKTYSEQELDNAFVIVEPARHRFRKIRP